MLKSIKSKLAVLGVGALALSNSAFAAITVDDKGVMSGTLEMAPFFGAVVVIVTALGTIVAIKAGIRLFKSGV